MKAGSAFSLRSLLALLLAASPAVVVEAAPHHLARRSLSPELQNILHNTHRSDLYTYPTDLTRGIIPKAFHSHNDYWRDIPFYSALSVGAVSVEADVWLINETLYVGHELSALTAERTFQSLYVNPILDVLKRQNPHTPFVTSDTKNGVFDTDSGQTLYLFVDVKLDGPTSWPYVLKALEPLRSAGYLTTYDGKTTKSAPVTVVGTGNTPLSIVQDTIPRDVFFDANLGLLQTTQSNITSDISPIASLDFAIPFGSVRQESFNDIQLATLRSLLRTAHDKKIKARFWDQPGWPIGTRNAVWRTLWDEGVDLLNVDDLEGAAAFWENKG